MFRGECVRIKSPRGSRGGEQRGDRYGVIVQAGTFLGPESRTVLIAPTSQSAPRAPFRPEVDFGKGKSLVLAEQTSAHAVERLGESVGQLSLDEMIAVDRALALMLGLD